MNERTPATSTVQLWAQVNMALAHIKPTVVENPAGARGYAPARG